MVDRILALLKEKSLTPSQFADEIGVQRSAMSHLISGRNKPSLEFMMKVLQRFPEVKPEYLLYGVAAVDRDMADEATIAKEIVPKVSATLFDQPVLTEIKPEPKPSRQARRDRTERKIEKIVVFYEDKTFREYEPE